jgi:hypothetical protein
VTKQPTCTDKGTRTYTCSGCGAKYTEEIAAAGHKWDTVKYTWTQTSSGYTCTAARVCKNDSSHVDTAVTCTDDDGVVTKELGARVDPASAKIAVDGRPVAAPERKRTVMLSKPVGVLSSTSDPFGGETVADIVRTPERLVPVGRLDKDSEGLLLMSNDGDLTLRLTHPRYEHEKTYVVRAAGH